MARKTREILIDIKGRDNGKRFVITEMPAFQAERWALRCLMAMMKSGMDIPEDIAQAGLLGVLTMGLKALGAMSFRDAEPLLDEMMQCIQFRFDVRNPIPRPLVDSDIEEVSTLFRLRKEVFDLHTGFFTPASRPESHLQTSPNN